MRPTGPCPFLGVPPFRDVPLLARLALLGSALGSKSPVLYADPVPLVSSRRDPTFVSATDGALFAFAYDTPPFEFA